MSKFKFSIFLVIVLAISSNTYADSSLEDILGQCDDGVDSVEFLTCASTTDLSNDELHQCMEDHSIPEYMCPVGEEDDQKCEWIIKNCKKYKCIANYSDNLVFKSVKSSESINAEAFDLGSTIFGVAIYSALVKPAIQSMN
ncbi:hypothetical protein KKA47_07545, partial [bacterium]|nr:hypothetical protein [bacterium]